MKKFKGIILGMVFLFGMTSAMDINRTTVIVDIEPVEETDCFQRAINVMNQAYNAGYDDTEVTWFGNVAYALCLGHTWDEIIN